MTREKAIEILSLYKQRLEESVSTELGNDIQAFEMAISTLENNYNSAEQTDGDLISRKAVLDCIGMTSLHYDLARRLRKLPTIPQNGDLISRQAVIEALKDNVVEIGGEEYCGLGVCEEEIESIVNELPSAEKTADNNSVLDNIRAEIDTLPRIKVGNSNSPTVKYCIDEILLYDLLEHYKESEEEE